MDEVSQEVKMNKILYYIIVQRMFFGFIGGNQSNGREYSMIGIKTQFAESVLAIFFHIYHAKMFPIVIFPSDGMSNSKVWVKDSFA